MRTILGYILFLAMAVSANAQSQTSVWWYPLGPPGATRYQPFKAPAADTPVVRWRTTALRSSRVVLVGALRPDSINGQQIVGQIGNEVRVLQSQGWLLDAVSEFFLPPGSDVRLTGLFNTLASTPLPTGQPNTVGLGVTRMQSAEAGRRLYGLLLDPLLAPSLQLAIQRLENRPDDVANNTASVFPVAAYRPPEIGGPIAVAMVTQDSYDMSAVDTMINGIRRYALNDTVTSVDPSWALKFAPKAYAQAPALAVDDEAGGLLVAPSVGAYAVLQTQVDQPIPGRGTMTTFANRAYGILMHAEQPNLIEPLENVQVPTGSVRAEAHSYVVELSRRSSEAPQKYRLVTENHDDARPGTPRMYLRRYDIGMIGQLGLVEDPQLGNVGWSIVQADLDGNDPSRQFPAGLVLNRGLEIVAAIRHLDGSRPGANRLYLIRYNDQALINGSPFGVYARQDFDGELLAAGDLIADDDQKDEIVIASDTTISILRFRRYSDPRMSAEKPEYFDRIVSYALDAPVTSAAIVDLEGDGSNDLVVVTETSTYLIGKSHPAPLGTLFASRSELCSGDTLSFKWSRAVGGGENGLRAEILRVDSGNVVVDSLIVASTPERFTHDLNGLPPGRYRLRLTDVDVASVTAESGEFTIQPVTIESFTVPTTMAGEIVTVSTRARCADSLILEFATSGADWRRVGSGPVAVVDDIATFTIAMPCPFEDNCDEATSEKPVRFRFSTTDGTIRSSVASTLVGVPQRTVDAPAVGTTNPRQRTLRWSPADFLCDSVRIRLSGDDGGSWTDAGTAVAAGGTADVDIPGEVEQEMLAQVCCDDGCGTGMARFVVSEIGDANFVAPNPFDPSDDETAGAAIVYRLTKPGSVTITIFDVSRAPVRTVVAGEPLGTGLHRATWDGRNGSGEIVADGTYICLIASSSGEKLALPLSVAKR